jgi:tripartite-type tricarboxylate transporter receptor subunit TctC
MSRKGGAWDELKRTISWTVDSLEPGEALEIQAQFESADIPSAGGALKFPLLVRAEHGALFSSVEMNSDFIDALSTPVKIELSQSGRVLHRKV